MEKHSVSRLSYLFAHLHLLSSDSFSSDLLSSNLSLLSGSALLCFSSVHIVGSLTSKLPSIKCIFNKYNDLIHKKSISVSSNHDTCDIKSVHWDFFILIWHDHFANPQDISRPQTPTLLFTFGRRLHKVPPFRTYVKNAACNAYHSHVVVSQKLSMLKNLLATN